jgi:ribonuclease VapC
VSSYVLDASALLALLQAEPGNERVAAVLPDAVMSSINLSEVIAKFANAGRSEPEIRSYLNPLGLNVIPFGSELAYSTGMLRPNTRALGLSFGDRACIALAESLKIPILTSDRAWTSLSLSVSVQLIR